MKYKNLSMEIWYVYVLIKYVLMKPKNNHILFYIYVLHSVLMFLGIKKGCKKYSAEWLPAIHLNCFWHVVIFLEYVT